MERGKKGSTPMTSPRRNHTEDSQKRVMEENLAMSTFCKKKDLSSSKRFTQQPTLDPIATQKSQLAPPLPLFHFTDTADAKNIESAPKTVLGEKLKSIVNNLDANMNGTTHQDTLQNPIHSKRLAVYFSALSYKELNYRQMESYQLENLSKVETNNSEQSYTKPEIFDYVVYESLFHVETLSERTQRNAGRMSEEIIFQEKLLKEEVNTHFSGKHPSHEGDLRNSHSKGSLPLSYTPSLTFDAEFESGNLEKAIRVIGRESLITSRTLDYLQDYDLPQPVDQEYDLTLRKDINTNGNIQWYYFSVTCPTDLKMTNKTYPLSVRFNIVNFQKKDSLYNYGMKPAVYSSNRRVHTDWYHDGNDVCYYKNGGTFVRHVLLKSKKRRSVSSNYTLTFTYTFEQPDTVYFAHTFPYTYSDLQNYLKNLEKLHKLSGKFHRRLLCETLLGNRCDVLTITDRSEVLIADKIKPSIIISARVHPGESNASYVMHGLIDFLLSNCDEACRLRKSFVFTIIPMLNPDGVIHGNYRCSLAATDLNRRYLDTHPRLHPTIAALKHLMASHQSNRGVLLYLDLHGHSRAKNSFVYGCDIIAQSEKIVKVIKENVEKEVIDSKRVYARVFPRILCSLSDSKGSGYFSYKDCSFGIAKSKFGTGRVVSWRDPCCIAGSYTIEMSFCGNGDNSEIGLLKSCSSSSNGNSGIAGIKSSNNLFKQSNHNGKSSSQLSTSGSEKSTEEQRLAAILKTYADQRHYSKADLRQAGKDVALAIYHFANLSHSDINNEIKIAAAIDSEERIRKASLSEMKLQSLNKRMTSIARNCETKQATSGSQRIRSFSTVDPHESSARSLSSHVLREKSSVGIGAWNDNNTNTSDSSEVATNDSGSSSLSLPPISNINVSQQSQSLPSLANATALNLPKPSRHTHSTQSDSKTQSSDDEEQSDEEDEEGEMSEDSVTHSEGEQTYVPPKPVDISNFSSFRSDRRGPPVCVDHLLDLIQPLARVQIVDDSLITRSHVKSSVYSNSAICKMLNLYREEFKLTDHHILATEHIGMRMKTELGIRKALNLHEGIVLEPLLDDNGEQLPIGDEEDIIDADDFLENASSLDGSESDPSVDNVPASKMIKSLSKYKDTKSLVNALKKVAHKKHRKLDRKGKKKDKTHQPIDDSLLEITAAIHAFKDSNAQSPLVKGTSDQSKVRERKKGSIFHQMPKTGTLYKLDHEESNPVSIQIKTVNFKDFDEANYLAAQHKNSSANDANAGATGESMGKNGNGNSATSLNGNGSRMSRVTSSNIITASSLGTNSPSNRMSIRERQKCLDEISASSPNAAAVIAAAVSNAMQQDSALYNVMPSAKPHEQSTEVTGLNGKEFAFSHLNGSNSPSNSNTMRTRHKSLRGLSAHALPKSLEEYFMNLNTESFKRRQSSFIITPQPAVDPHMFPVTTLTKTPQESTRRPSTAGGSNGNSK